MGFSLHKQTQNMDDESECFELFINDGVLVKSHSQKKNDVDFLNNLGTLSIVEHKLGLGKCIEWHQCDVSIEGDDQEWAIIKDNKCENGNLNDNFKNIKTPIIQIPFKNLLSFKISKNNKQLTLVEKEGTASTTFYFQNGHANYILDFLKKYLNTSVSKRDLNLYMVRDQKEVQALEKSFAELDLFSDDSTRSDAIWNFIKKLHDNPYETTMCAFTKVTDAFLYKSPSREINNIAKLLNKSLTSDDLLDFHGRISSDDYELVTKGTLLPPRTLPLRSSPLTSEQWSIFFDESGRILEPEIVKEHIFHGGISLAGELRSEVWKFLLGYYPWNSTFHEREALKKQKKEEYFTMKLQWKTISPIQEDNFMGYKERKSSIEKDVCRTDRNMPYFAGDNNSNLEVLQNILMTYIMYNFDLGYVQGMSDLLSPLLVQLNDEVDVFWCFVGFMEKVNCNFDLDQAGMTRQLQQLFCLLCCIEPELATYLEQQDSKNMSFCFRWLLILFKREFTYDEIFILWEVLWTGMPCQNFHLLICAAILDTEKETLMSKNYGFTEILKHVNELANNINLDMILRKAEGMYVQLSTAAKIPAAVREIIGLEPVTESEEDKDCNGISVEEENISVAQNEDSNHSAPYISIDSQELAFDNSISLQYL